ncbi:LamG-like jellyroll fold domain-containing protein [Streptomyces gardneri]|uniref:LamG domain-containing protein n=1 Tax=Streptomyces gardneri TaxID=66892 RepID=UPI0036B3DAB3
MVQGRSVEVASLTTETNRVLANSDGTFTLEASAVAERVRKNGAWTPVDTTLVKAANGRLVPKAAQDVSLSGGGADGPLATITRDGRSFELASKWKLPVPRVSGSSAVYASVKPDVDLVVQVRPDGFTYNLVVHTREAAADPELRSIRFPVKSRGLTLNKSASGAVSLQDPSNRPVFASSAALMWDSAPATAATAAAAPKGRTAALSEPAEDVALPDPGARTAVAGVSVSAETLVVTPDPSFLTAPDTQYPVVIDPPSFTATLTGWTTLWSNLPNTSFWRTSHALGVGYDAYVDNKKARSLYQFDTRKAAGKKILDAQFTAYEIWSANCGPKTVNLYRTNAISPSTTFEPESKVTWKWVSSRDVAKGYSSSCPDGDVAFDATAAVAHTANAMQSTTTLGLKANESDPLAWKQFLSPADERSTTERAPRLSITYVSEVEDAPKYVKMQDPNLACTSSSNPVLIRDTSPRLTATPFSDDGAQASLRPLFDLYDRTTGTKVTTLRPAEWNVSGVDGQVNTPTLVSGHTYSFHAATEYRYTFEGATSTIGGDVFAAGCYFKVDVTAPPKPVVTSTVYPPCGSTKCTTDPERGGVGMPGQFVIKAGASDVRRYDIWFNGVKIESKVFTTNTSSYTVTVVPDKRLSNVLRVQTFDAAGNASDTTDYLFKVARGSDPVGAWSFDEASGTTAADASGSGRHLTLSKSSWTPRARLDAGLDDAANTGNATTATSVIDTSKSFTVAAWAKLESKQQTTVLTQMGGKVGAFQLYYSAGADRWVFNRYASDAYDTETTIVRAVGKRPAVIGAWTHLMGVYDANAKEIRLFVNGVLNAETPFTTPWAATKALEVGRWGAPQLWADVDQVQVWNRTVFPSELGPVVNAENPDTGHLRPALLAQWMMDEPSGALSVPDASGRGNPLALSGGYDFVESGDPGHANTLLMDETLLPHGTSNVRLDINGSFTLTGWFDPSYYPTLEDGRAHDLTFFSLPGTKSDALRVSYSQKAGQTTGTWNFGLFSTDVLNAPGSVFSFSKERPSGWVHVAAVYNAPERSLKLYLGGRRVGAESGQAVADAGAFQPTVPLNVGRGRRSDGELDNHLTGLLDDLRVYTGAMSPGEIAGLAVVEEPTVPIE